MKSLLLAFGAEIFVFMAVTVIFCLRKGKASAKVLTIVFFATLPLLVLVIVATPANIGMLSPNLTNSSITLDLFFSVFTFVGGFFGGLLQLYNLADRGFSLRILIDAVELQCGSTSVDRVMSNYSAGKGISWMYEKRIDGMVAVGLVTISQDEMMLTPKGCRAGHIFSNLRNFTKQPPMIVDGST